MTKHRKHEENYTKLYYIQIYENQLRKKILKVSRGKSHFNFISI